MSKIATYTFLPWLRQGIANQISSQTGSRATIPIELLIRGKLDATEVPSKTIYKDIEIFGPGDITGLDSNNIVKVEPRNWITNFEPNYLPYIEFYEEDLPWRYSPMSNPPDDGSAAAHRLQPWLALIILKEGEEFRNGRNIKDKPLPFIELTQDAKLPPVDELWAWAHVHINRDILGEGNFTSKEQEEIANQLRDLLDEDPDLAYSRIICPRKLEENTAYHAFLVPCFESGRKAGLGETPSGVAHDTAAWNAATIVDGHQMPYYYRWYFRTGTIGDFEYLVRLLEPKPIDNRVGVRDMDVQTPNNLLYGIQDEDLGGILRLGGALRVPRAVVENIEKAQNYEYWAFREDLTTAQITDLETDTQPGKITEQHPFQRSLATFINLTDDYNQEISAFNDDERALEANKKAAETLEEIAGNATLENDDTDPQKHQLNNNPDPLITAPLYGRWHALTERLKQATETSTGNYNWVHELNLDPRWRVSAGFGTKVVQENQESYMKAAWKQVGDILEANKRVRQAQLAKFTSLVWYHKHLPSTEEKDLAKWLFFASPIHRRIVSNGKTVFYQKLESKLTNAVTSVNIRKILRPRGQIVKRRWAFDRKETNGASMVNSLIEKVNNGEVSAAPPREIPEGTQGPNDLADAAKPKLPAFILKILKRFPWIKWIVLALSIIMIFLMVVFPELIPRSVGSTIAASLLVLFLFLKKWAKEVNNAKSVLEENDNPKAVNELPNSPDFEISEPKDDFNPTLGGDTDSEEATKFKDALKEAYKILEESIKLGEKPERPTLDISKVNEAVFQKINPELTVPRWVSQGVALPPYILGNKRPSLKEKFTEAMAYPRFDLPMYKPLADYSAELFLPNINHIAQNSISLLETNQKFIEAYMVGLNHEFARELLWREYPTDQRGSYFRQFWESKGKLDLFSYENIDEGVKALKERYNAVHADRQISHLMEYRQRLLDHPDADNPIDAKFLNEAHQQIVKEELKDIKPIHYWKRNNKLGQHDNREKTEESEEEIVLVIRGELLKKYPTAVIYAHRAVWQDEDNQPVLDDTQTIDPTKERTLKPINEGDQENPPDDTIRSPLYEAKVDPDIYFFGFDLNTCEVKGGTGKEEDPVNEQCADQGITWDDPGWFFVIKERPGEPRFGLDIGGGTNVVGGKIEIWNDLGWKDIIPEGSSEQFIKITESPKIVAEQALEGDDSEKIDQQIKDKNVEWGTNMNSAELAYILYQVPVLVAVHGSEMLPH